MDQDRHPPAWLLTHFFLILKKVLARNRKLVTLLSRDGFNRKVLGPTFIQIQACMLFKLTNPSFTQKIIENNARYIYYSGLMINWLV
jgi:hypothetical protein